MARRGVGEPVPELAVILDGVTQAAVEEDDHEFEHLEFLRHHPGFQDALDRLREDLSEGGVEWSPALIAAARADPEAMAYPARQFAEKWGVTVAAVYYLALTRFSSVETEWLAVRSTPLEYVVRIPRPLSPARRKALMEWLKAEKDPGPAEHSWDKVGKRRYDLSREALAVLPWFDRWNAGEEPAAIYRSLPEVVRLKPPGGQGVGFEIFLARLVSAWERMVKISPSGIRNERPSKEAA